MLLEKVTEFKRATEDESIQSAQSACATQVPDISDRNISQEG